MKKIEAPSVNEALIKASEELGVSVTEIEYEIIQESSKGFFGLFGKKPAIIVASTKAKPRPIVHANIPVIPEPTPETPSEPPKRPKVKIVSKARDRVIQEITEVEAKVEYNCSRSEGEIYGNFFREEAETPPHRFPETRQKPIAESYALKTETIKEVVKETIKESAPKEPTPKIVSKPTPTPKVEKNKLTPTEIKEKIENKYLPSQEEQLATIAMQVQKEINELFALMPFNIDPIKVSVFDEHTLFIEFRGEDAALLIGKEGYRYKALSYMLFHWINTRYSLMVRLEIAEFLHNQELMIAHYLAPVIETIKETGKGQTRPLDGVLAYIALRKLRDTFPDKYVSFRKTPDGGKYVIVNEFYR